MSNFENMIIGISEVKTETEVSLRDRLSAILFSLKVLAFSVVNPKEVIELKYFGENCTTFVDNERMERKIDEMFGGSN
jgi:hypothetical protein